MTLKKISWIDLHNDKALRRAHYQDMYLQTLNIDLFISRMDSAFYNSDPCRLYFELGDTGLVRLDVWAIPEIEGSGGDLLEWVATWAAARKLEFSMRMREMENRWPYLVEIRNNWANRVIVDRQRRRQSIPSWNTFRGLTVLNRLKMAFKGIGLMITDIFGR